MRGKVVRLAAAAEPFATGDKLTVSGKFNRVIAAAKSPAKAGLSRCLQTGMSLQRTR
jgi:hypothetical protein